MDYTTELRKRDLRFYTLVGIGFVVSLGLLGASGYISYSKKQEKIASKSKLEIVVENAEINSTK